MRKPEKVHILFERSGTFQRAFEKYGIPAVDYDLEAEHEGVKCVDIFEEMCSKQWESRETIFSGMKDTELIFAFFPCTYFSDQSQLVSRGDSKSQKDWTLERKLLYSSANMQRRCEYYEYLCRLVGISLKIGIPLIIENPSGRVNFLKWYFPVKPGVVIKDRRGWGDEFKKPTQFFFVNCEPGFYLENSYGSAKPGKIVEGVRGFARSRIAGQFAENFIENVLKDETW